MSQNLRGKGLVILSTIEYTRKMNTILVDTKKN